MTGMAVWLIISGVLAVIGALVAFFMFLKPSNATKFKGFIGWAYDFLNFKKLFIDTVVRILYLICAIFVTLGSFAVIGKDFLMFLLILVGGNLGIRILYEFLLIFLIVCRNTSEISKNTAKLVELKEKENN